MTWNNDQWQEAIVALANSGLSAAANGLTGSGVPLSADYIGFNSGGNLTGVSSTNPLPVAASHASAVDATNSSTATLTSGSVFTGTWQSSLNYSAISVQAFADQASAASGLQVQQSQDGTNADTSDNFSVSASTNFQTTVNLTGKYYRIKYTNGGTGQATFRLQTVAQTSEVVLPRTLTTLGNLKVEVQNAQALGQTTKSASTSVTIASDQSSSAQPLTVEQSYQTAIRASHAFKISTGALTATVGPYMALSLWNPSGSGKTAHVTRITSYYETTANHPYLYLYKETSDPSTSWTTPAALTPVCIDLGSGNTSVLTVNRTNTGQAASLTGTLLHTQDTGAGANVEAIAGGTMEEIKIPPNSGLTIYLNAINTTQYGITVSVFEETV